MSTRFSPLALLTLFDPPTSIFSMAETGRTSVFSGWGLLFVLLVSSACSGERPEFGNIKPVDAGEPTRDGSTDELSTSTDGPSTSTDEPTDELSTSTDEPSTSTDGGPGSGSTDECPEGCVVDGTCYSVGERNPNNPCATCDPDSDSSGWTNVAEGEACDDGMYCTVDDRCSAGNCEGVQRACDDGIACNGAEVCDETQAQCAGARSICGEDETCNVENDECSSTCGGCAIGGVCYLNGEASTTNPCMVCDVSTSADAWSTASAATCDDSDPCTSDDRCDESGACAGTPPSPAACETAACADAQGCLECEHECASAAVKCEDGAVSSCVADPTTGCREWSTPVSCESDKCNTSTECAPVDPCAKNTCLNGSICQPNGSTYTCACAAGYTGANCETDIDECASSPCQHGGACVDGANDYQCVCPGAYTGDDCELPRFELLPGDSYVSLSGDGTVAVGDDDMKAVSHVDGQTKALASFSDYDWSFAADVSTDGSVIVGWCEYSTETYSARALKWQGNSVTELAAPASATSCKATSVSADGSTIVGACFIGYDQHIVRWQGSQATNLGQVTGSTNCFNPSVSADGNAIVGTCIVDGFEQPFRWTPQSGMQALTGYPSVYCRLTSVSSNGSKGVGSCGSGASSRGILYNGGASVTEVGSSWLFETDATWYPTRQVTPDGNWVIGDTLDNIYGVAVRWTFSGTPTKVSDLLSTSGGTSGAWRLGEGHDLSDDGLTILGAGSDNSADRSYWLVRLF